MHIILKGNPFLCVRHSVFIGVWYISGLLRDWISLWLFQWKTVVLYIIVIM